MRKQILAFLLGCYLLGAGTLPAQNLCDGLLLYYPFTGNAADSSGNRFDGIVHNAFLTTGHQGVPGSAYQFTGSDSYIEWPNAMALKPQLPVSFSFWVYADQISGLKGIVSTDFTEDFYSGFWVSILPDSTVAFAYGSGGTTSVCCRRSAIGQTKLMPRQWYFITAVMQGPVSMSLYINGTPDPIDYSGDGDALYYAYNPGSLARVDVQNIPVYYLQGRLDDFAFWGKALTQDDVTFLYTHGMTAHPAADFLWSYILPDVHFYDTSYSASFISRLWEFGDGTTSAEKAPVHTYSGTQTGWRVCLTITDSCGESTFCDSVYCMEPLTSHFTFTNVSSHDRMIRFTDETPGASSWNWHFGDGGTSAEKNPVHIYSGYGNYTVCLTTGDPSGHNTYCSMLKIIPLNTGSPAIILYPNPTEGKVFIRVKNDAGAATILLTNLLGTTLFREDIQALKTDSPVQIDLSGYAKGIYFISCTTGDIDKVWKLILQ